MLGNFSFGDYFKEEAIAFAWEVSTQVFGFDPEKIWITVFREDDEAFEIWKKIVPEKRIVRMEKKTIFGRWAIPDPAALAQSSTMTADQNTAMRHLRKKMSTGERYFEFWNLVFMQFNRDASGKMTPFRNNRSIQAAALSGSSL